MPDNALSFFQRLVLAFYAFFAILFRADFALAAARLRDARRAGRPLPAEPEALPAAGARVEAPPVRTGEPGTPSAPREPPVTVTAGAGPAPKTVPPPPAPPPKTAVPPPPAPNTAAPAPKTAVPPPPAPAAPAVLAPGTSAPAPAAAPVSPALAPTKPTAAPPRAPAPVAPAPAPVAPAPKPESANRAALHVLTVLQREGRLVDFIEESLEGFTDSQIGAAARTVHAGCKRAIEEHFRLEPVFREPEGARVTVQKGFDPAAVRLTGTVVGQAPFQGALRHHGWRAKDVFLPPLPDALDASIVAPAEVEL